MKYDLNQKANRFAQRTLPAFSQAMLELLTQKPFEKITVNELCETCNYPRATFYNYFDDSYDLLHYCWISISQKIHIEDYPDMKPEERILILFDRIYDYFDSHREQIQKIMAVNPLDGAMAVSLNLFIKQQACRIMLDCSCQETLPIPYELVAEHYSNTLELIIEWTFLRKQLKTKKEAETCLRTLLEPMIRK